MTLRGLEIFVKVAELKSMNNAAEALFISQPSVSGAIADLEKEFNVLLFERLNKRIYITEAGEQLLVYAKRMLSIKCEIERNMRDIDDMTPIRIGATVTIGTSILQEVIKKLDKMDIQVKIDDTPTIEQGILNNTLDIGLVEGRIQNRDILVTSFMKDELMCICKDSGEFKDKKNITLEEVLEYPLIFREKNSGTRLVIDEAIEKVMSATGKKANIIWDCNNTQTIISSVKNGMGISILSPKLVEETEGVKAIPIADAGISRDFLMIVHKDKVLNRNMKKFVNELI